MNTTSEQIKPIETKKPCSERKIINVRISRDDDGMRIFMQSPVDWKIMKREKKFTLGGVTCFQPNMEQVEGLESFFSTEQYFEYNGLPNLTMLLAEKIKEGVTFSFPPYPISENKIKRWAEQFKQDAKVLFLTYVKPVDFSVIITSTTIERENHD